MASTDIAWSDRGQPAADHIIDGADAIDTAVTAAVQQARYCICIYGIRLKATLFRGGDLRAALTPLITGDPRHQVRVLVQDHAYFLHKNVALRELARQFSSYVKVRKPGAGRVDVPDFFLTADAVAYIDQPKMDKNTAYTAHYAPAAVRRLQHQFDDMWQRSGAVPELFTLGI